MTALYQKCRYSPHPTTSSPLHPKTILYFRSNNSISSCLLKIMFLLFRLVYLLMNILNFVNRRMALNAFKCRLLRNIKVCMCNICLFLKKKKMGILYFLNVFYFEECCMRTTSYHRYEGNIN